MKPDTTATRGDGDVLTRDIAATRGDGDDFTAGRGIFRSFSLIRTVRGKRPHGVTGRAGGRLLIVMINANVKGIKSLKAFNKVKFFKFFFRRKALRAFHRLCGAKPRIEVNGNGKRLLVLNTADGISGNLSTPNLVVFINAFALVTFVDTPVVGVVMAIIISSSRPPRAIIADTGKLFILIATAAGQSRKSEIICTIAIRIEVTVIVPTACRFQFLIITRTAANSINQIVPLRP